MIRFDPRRAAALPLPAALPVPLPAGPMRRPRLLVRAGRAGAAIYRRERDLPALLPGFAAAGRRAGDLPARLELAEAACEAQRRAGAPEYSVRRHVGLLSALLAERATAAAAAALS